MTSVDPGSYGAISESHLEAAWRACKWDVTLPSSVNSQTGLGLHASLFQCLRSVRDLTAKHKNESAFK
jgi:hypothetical protein